MTILLQGCNNFIKSFFEEKLPQFSVFQEWEHAPYWHIEFVYDNVKIIIDGDIGFSVNVFIEDKDFPLWQYDRSVNEKLTTSKENILYQLNVLKRFFSEIGY